MLKLWGFEIVAVARHIKIHFLVNAYFLDMRYKHDINAHITLASTAIPHGL